MSSTGRSTPTYHGSSLPVPVRKTTPVTIPETTRPMNASPLIKKTIAILDKSRLLRERTSVLLSSTAPLNEMSPIRFPSLKRSESARETIPACAKIQESACEDATREKTTESMKQRTSQQTQSIKNLRDIESEMPKLLAPHSDTQLQTSERAGEDDYKELVAAQDNVHTHSIKDGERQERIFAAEKLADIISGLSEEKKALIHLSPTLLESILTPKTLKAMSKDTLMRLTALANECVRADPIDSILSKFPKSGRGVPVGKHSMLVHLKRKEVGSLRRGETLGPDVIRACIAIHEQPLPRGMYLMDFRKLIHKIPVRLPVDVEVVLFPFLLEETFQWVLIVTLLDPYPGGFRFRTQIVNSSENSDDDVACIAAVKAIEEYFKLILPPQDIWNFEEPHFRNCGKQHATHDSGIAVISNILSFMDIGDKEFDLNLGEIECWEKRGFYAEKCLEDALANIEIVKRGLYISESYEG